MRRGVLVAALTVVCVLFTALTTPGPAGAAKKTYILGLSQDNIAGDPWRAGLVKNVLDEAAKYPNVKVIVTDAMGNTDKQIADIEDLVAQKIDVLLVSPAEAKPLTPIISKVFRSGIPVIVLDREIASDDYTTFIGASNVEIGRKAGEFIASYLKGKGNIVEIQGSPGASPTIDRREPMRQVISKYPGIKIVASAVANYDQLQAIAAMEDILQAHPKGTIDLVYSHDDSMALGVLKVLKERGRTEIKIVGCDGQKQALEAIMSEDNIYIATFTYPFPGALGVKVAMAVLNGKTVPKRIPMTSHLITKENVIEFYDPNSDF